VKVNGALHLTGHDVGACSNGHDAAGFKIQLPAVEELDAGYAHLVNGWEVPYAQTIDRRCDSPAESFSEFLRLVPNHTSIYCLGQGALTAVTC